MSIPNLPVDFKDDILASSNTKRKYQQINNSDGTISLEDKTVYSQTGSEFGASQMNQTNGAINDIYNNRIVDLDALDLVTEPGFFVDALAVAELNDNTIIEQGANHTKYANGKLECWGRSTTSGSTGGATIDFPVDFIDASYIVLATPSYHSSGYPTFECSTQRSTVSAFNLYTRKSDGGLLGGVVCNWYAIGRWK